MLAAAVRVMPPVDVGCFGRDIPIRSGAIAHAGAPPGNAAVCCSNNNSNSNNMHWLTRFKLISFLCFSD